MSITSFRVHKVASLPEQQLWDSDPLLMPYGQEVSQQTVLIFTTVAWK